MTRVAGGRADLHGEGQVERGPEGGEGGKVVLHLVPLEAENLRLRLGSGLRRPKLGGVGGETGAAGLGAEAGAVAAPGGAGDRGLRGHGLLQFPLLQQFAGRACDGEESEALPGGIVEGIVGLLDAPLRRGLGYEQGGRHQGVWRAVRA